MEGPEPKNDGSALNHEELIERLFSDTTQKIELSLGSL